MLQDIVIHTRTIRREPHATCYPSTIEEHFTIIGRMDVPPFEPRAQLYMSIDDPALRSIARGIPMHVLSETLGEAIPIGKKFHEADDHVKMGPKLLAFHVWPLPGRREALEPMDPPARLLGLTQFQPELSKPKGREFWQRVAADRPRCPVCGGHARMDLWPGHPAIVLDCIRRGCGYAITREGYTIDGS